MECSAAADIFITQSRIIPLLSCQGPGVHNYKTQNRNYSDLTKNYWQTLSSSWTKMLALNFLISVRE